MKRKTKRRKLAAKTGEKDRLLDLIATVLELVRDQKRNPGEVADVLQVVKDHRDFISELGLGVKSESTKGRGAFKSALSILGQHRVLTPERVAEALNPLRKRVGLSELVPSQGIAVPYSDEVLRRHADGRWLLIYSYGISLREQRLMAGTDSNQQPCFYKGSTWWLNAKEDSWAAKGVKLGWYLVSTEGSFGGQTWIQQGQSIQKLGESYERADEHLMGEACLSAYLINKGERLLENFYHWGKSLDSGSDCVCVGRFGRDGLLVFHCPPGWDDDSDLRVCLLRKPA